MAFHYRIYGLPLKSNRAIGLLPAHLAEEPALSVRWTTDKSESPDENVCWQRVLTRELMRKRGITLWRALAPEGTFTKVRFDTAQGHLDFILDPLQQKLWIVFSPQDTEADLDSYFVGPVLGCVLRLRGILCLHASVVNIDGQAIAIAGRKKSGKSTFAAALALQGARVVSDDMAVLEAAEGHFLAHSGYPQLRLWPQSVEAIYHNAGHDTGVFPQVYTHREKRYLPLDAPGAGATFWPHSLPLAAVYTLQRLKDAQAAHYIEAVASHQKVVTLLANTFGSYAVSDQMRPREFTVLVGLSKMIPVRRFVFSDDLTQLPQQSRAILRDFRGLQPRTLNERVNISR